MSETPEKLLESEAGRFFLELPAAMIEARELVESSSISPEKKVECQKILDDLVKAAERETEVSHTYNDIYDVACYPINRLAEITVDKKERTEEEVALYELLRTVISKTLYSAKGWKYPPTRM